MNSWRKNPLRVAGRLLWLGGELFLAAVRYGFHRAVCPDNSDSARRAIWLQTASRRILRVFHVETQFMGDIPANGLLVCNHLSYLDILVLSAITPCVFVAKREVKQWPILGWFAKQAGTVFVHRECRAQAGKSVDEIESILATGAVVVLFPEGTSSGGKTVLPFKSSLLEPVVRQTHSLTAGVLEYHLAEGEVSEEVCYWKDMTLVPHLVNLCSKPDVRASVRFSRLRAGVGDRKQLARQLHSEILRMKHAVVS